MNGNKTYIVAVAGILAGIAAFLTGEATLPDLITTLTVGASALGIRHGMKTGA